MLHTDTTKAKWMHRIPSHPSQAVHEGHLHFWVLLTKEIEVSGDLGYSFLKNKGEVLRESQALSTLPSLGSTLRIMGFSVWIIPWVLILRWICNSYTSIWEPGMKPYWQQKQRRQETWRTIMIYKHINTTFRCIYLGSYSYSVSCQDWRVGVFIHYSFNKYLLSTFSVPGWG